MRQKTAKFNKKGMKYGKSRILPSPSGIPILNLSHAVMGPACRLMLADMGGQIIKIERPDGMKPAG